MHTNHPHSTLAGLAALLLAAGGCASLDGLVSTDPTVTDAGAAPPSDASDDANSIGEIVRSEGDAADLADAGGGEACADGVCGCSDGRCLEKLVFVTSGLYSADLGGLAGADAKCQAEALSSKRAGTYKAWLADALTDPYARMTHATVPYRLADGTLVANDWVDLTSGALRHPIDQKLDASRVGVNEGTCPKMARVWSGSTPAGVVAPRPGLPDPMCSDWSSSSSSSSGPAADAFATDSFWSQGCGATCDSRLSLYCVEQ